MSDIVTGLAVAALCGLAVGVEREWSGHATGPHGRFAGMRTFLLLGGLGGCAGWLASRGEIALAVALVGGAMAFIVAAYVAAARPGGPAVEGTTEAAALLIVALGTLAGFGYLSIAGGAAAVMVLVLSEKERLQAAVSHVDAREMRATFQFAVLALVVLPVLPDETFGPLGGIRPRALWIVVLIFSGLNFLGYIARRAVGVTRGNGVAGLLGGLISSTAVTWQFSRQSREREAAAPGLALGIVAACTVLLPRLLVLSAVLNVQVALALLPFLLPPFIAGALMVGFAMMRRWDGDATPSRPDDATSPLRLWSAVRMALAFQVTLMALDFVRARLGDQGVLVSAGILGLTDMDALTLSMNRLGTTPDVVGLAARAIAIGVVANTVLKLGLVLGLGSARLRKLAGAGLALLLGIALATLGILW